MANLDSTEKNQRRKVFEITEKLCETVNPLQLEQHLPYLHGNGWDEIIEERFVNKLCGYPTCSKNARPNNRQMYHIDRKSKKIFENSNQRKKFCSDHCFEKSTLIRNQLCDEALWITGETTSRLQKKFEIPLNDSVESTENETNASISSPVRFKPKKTSESNIELVEDLLLAKITDLKIRDAESEKESSDSENEDFKNIQPYEKCSDDEDFAESVKRFVCSNSKSKIEKTEEKKKTDQTTKMDKSKEEEILNRLRAKYGKTPKSKKLPILIEAKRIEPKENKIPNEQNPMLDWLKDLYKSWITEKTKKFIKEGGRPGGGELEQVLLDFLSGKSMIEDVEKSINLPNVDKYNIKETRLKIIMQSLRNNWSILEAKLEVKSTRRHIFSRIVATFNLTSENITGWSKSETFLIVISIFLLICQIDTELEDEFLQNGHISPSLQEISQSICQVDFKTLLDLNIFLKSIVGI